MAVIGLGVLIFGVLVIVLNARFAAKRIGSSLDNPSFTPGQFLKRSGGAIAGHLFGGLIAVIGLIMFVVGLLQIAFGR